MIEKLDLGVQAQIQLSVQMLIQNQLTMIHQKEADTLKALLLKHFNIQSAHFNWELPLEKLDANFQMLGNLVFLEQLIEKEFGKKVPLLENISTAIHTPKDIIELVITHKL